MKVIARKRRGLQPKSATTVAEVRTVPTIEVFMSSEVYDRLPRDAAYTNWHPRRQPEYDLERGRRRSTRIDD